MQAGKENLSQIPKLDFYEYSGNYGHTEAIKISIKNGSIFTLPGFQIAEYGINEPAKLF